MKTVIESFYESVEKFPDKIAISDKEGSYSYNELDEISTQIAGFILDYCKNQGINIEKNIEEGKNGERIAVIFPRRKIFLGILLGILKAGCCFINIDPGFPIARKNHIIHDSQCKFIISSSEIDTSLIEGEVIDIDEILNSQNTIMERIDLSKLDNEGVILYTSGSTGVSKGVVHSQKFFNRTIMSKWQDIYEFSSEDMTACMAGFSFTVVFCDLLTPMVHGASVYLIDENERLNLSKIYEIIQEKNITSMFMPPKVLTYIAKTYDDLKINCIWTWGEKLYNVTERDYKIIENYGCSEAPFVTYQEVKKSNDPKLLGKLIEFWNAILLDENGNIVTKPGIIGELCLIGDSLALEYLNLPEQTEAKFIDNPKEFISELERNGESSRPNDLILDEDLRMFKTGDLMAWNEDGKLTFHGRNDYMVKLNGYRVELGEVERVLLQNKNITETVCVLRNINGGDNLCCFYVLESPVDNEEEFISRLKEEISQKLAEYMIPSIFKRLDAIPRNINGKVDRSALPEIDVGVHKGEFEKPNSPLEYILCEGFANVLNLDLSSISINDSFYDLGGNSILTMELLDYLNVSEVSAMEIFKGQTVKRIAELITSKGQINEKDLRDTEIEEMNKDHGLTPFQSRLLIDQSCDFNSTVWNIPTMFDLGDADAEKLKDAVQTVIDNHPSLSVSFKRDDKGAILQYYQEGLLDEVIIEEMDENALKDIIPNLVDTFDIFGGPLSRFRIFKTEKSTYLFIDIHHLIIDGTSSNILLNEITAIYHDEDIEFNDYYFTFLKETDGLKDSKDYLKAKEYYLDNYGQLSDWTLVPKSDLSQEGYGMTITGICPTGIFVGDLENAERHYKTSRNVLAVAAALKAQSIHADSNKVLVNWVYNNRNNHSYDDTVGCLIKSFPVGIKINDFEDDYELLDEIKKQVINGIANGSYEYLCENYESFTTDTLFVNYLGSLRNSDGLKDFNPKVIDLPREKDIAKMRVAIAILEDDNGAVLTGVEYCTDLYSRETSLKFHDLLNKELMSLIKF